MQALRCTYVHILWVKGGCRKRMTCRNSEMRVWLQWLDKQNACMNMNALHIVLSVIRDLLLSDAIIQHLAAS